MSEELYIGKVKQAAKLIFFQRHRKPGIKGWELKKALGKNYVKIVELLNDSLSELGLQINIISEAQDTSKNLTEDQYEKATFYITIKESISNINLVMSGWRIDYVAALAVTIAYIISKQGKSSRKEVELILSEKFPIWMVERSISRFIRAGYLNEDENNVLYLDWRTRAEIDQKVLLNLILGESIDSNISKKV